MVKEEIPHKSSQHEDVSMRKVNQFNNPVNHGIT